MVDRAVGLVLLDAVAWTGISVVVGFTASRLPDRWFARDTWLTRIRPFERDGRRWDAVRVRRWKDALPEAGGVFADGSKARLGGRAGVTRHLVESRRAEWVHWTLLAAGPVFAVWNPPWLAGVMAAFAVAFNAPFIVVLRFNRARLLRVGRRAHPAPGGGAVPPGRPLATGSC